MTATSDRPQLGGLSASDAIGRSPPPESSTLGSPGVGLQRRRRSSLTRRILTLNVLALAIPVAGLFSLDEYRNDLVRQQLDLLRTEGDLFSGALAASGVVTGPSGDE